MAIFYSDVTTYQRVSIIFHHKWPYIHYQWRLIHYKWMFILPNMDISKKRPISIYEIRCTFVGDIPNKSWSIGIWLQHLYKITCSLNGIIVHHQDVNTGSFFSISRLYWYLDCWCHLQKNETSQGNQVQLNIKQKGILPMTSHLPRMNSPFLIPLHWVY